MKIWPKPIAIWFALCACIFVGNAVIACDNAPTCGPYSDWYESTLVELTLVREGIDGSADWTISLNPSRNDFYVEKHEKYEGTVVDGELAVVSGRILLTKGLTLEAGYEIDAIDGPMLMMQLLLNVLGFAVPEGPDGVPMETPFDHLESETPIQVGTASASGTFGVPWRARGVLTPEASGGVAFDLHFESGNDPDSVQFHMTGRMARVPFTKLPPEMPLEGWRLHQIGPYSRQHENGTIYDYGAQPSPEAYPSIRELRESIERRSITPNNAMESDA